MRMRAFTCFVILISSASTLGAVKRVEATPVPTRLVLFVAADRKSVV